MKQVMEINPTIQIVYAEKRHLGISVEFAQLMIKISVTIRQKIKKEVQRHTETIDYG